MMAEGTVGPLRAMARRWNYDVTVRCHAVARQIRGTNPGRCERVLDVGSGATGLAPFLPEIAVFGLDRQPAPAGSDRFVRASALELPFRDESWDVVTCVDVIEHLTLPDRTRALSEAARVCRRFLVVAFPFGAGARRADASLAEVLAASGRTQPPWLVEHLRQPHPETDWVERTLRAGPSGQRVVSIRRTYNESLRLQRVHRTLSRRFLPGYRVFSLLCSLVTPLLARPLAAEKAYRCVLGVDLSSHNTRQESPR